MAWIVVLWFIVVSTAASSCVRVAVVADFSPPVKAAYWVFTPTTSNFSSSLTQINASDFTHLFFASVTLDASDSVGLLPPPGDTSLSALQSFPSIVRVAINPTVKTLLTISGNASAFSAMAASPASRLAFINSSIALARNLSFDGLDLDWEYPASDTDMANLAFLVSEWRTACVSSNFSTNLLLTAVVKYNVTLIPGTAISSVTYPVQAIDKSLDWVNIKAFDYHGAWEPTRTGEHTSLFDASPYQTDYGVRQWLAAGLLQKLAVLGLAMYGRTWILQDPAQNIVGAPAVRAGPGDGFYTYDQIKAFVNSSKAYCRDDAVTRAAFCYGKLCEGTPTPTPSACSVVWVGYDNPRSIATKVRYLKAKDLRGYFLWSLGFDRNGDLSKQVYGAP